MPAGQTLRWWEEERQESRTVSATLPVPVAESSLPAQALPQETLRTETIRDIGEELEAEAVARAVAAERLAAESIVFPFPAAQALRKIDRQLAWGKWIFGIAFLLCLANVAVGHGHEFGRFQPLLNLLIYSNGFWSQIALRRKLAKQKVALTVTPTGIDPHLPGVAVGVIPWRYITDIRVGKSRETRNGQDLLIELRDLDQYKQTLDKKTAKLLGYHLTSLKPFGWLSRKNPPSVIRRAGYLLPLPPEAIVARIAAYESVKRG